MHINIIHNKRIIYLMSKYYLLHIKDAEDEYWQQRNNHVVDGHNHYISHLIGYLTQPVALDIGKTKAKQKGDNQSGHNIHQRWYMHREIGRKR